MGPLKLTLEGFLGVRDGMKRDRLVLDLESLPVGLIALTGPNGAGKSTIMDNLHPYRIMPSRAAKLSVDAFSYWDHIYGAQAVKELEWEHGGARYRSSFAFRKPGKTGKAEYFLTRLTDTGIWVPVISAAGTASDGKAETYDQCVESICGSLESFFTSVFSAQNRRPLAAYGASEIKGLLAELLKIDHLRALSAKAGDVAKVLMRNLDVVQREIAALSSKRDRHAVVERTLMSDSLALNDVRQARESSMAALAHLTQQRASLVAKQAEHAGTDARLQELASRRRELAAALQTVSADHGAATQRFGQRRHAIQQSVVTHQGVMGQRDAIRGAGAARDACLLVIGQEESRSGRLQEALHALEAKRLSHAELTASLAGLQQQGTSKAALAASLEQQASVIHAVPCAGDAMHGRCPLLAQARQASIQAKEQGISLQALRQTFKAQRQQAEALGVEVAKLATLRGEWKASTDALNEARRRLQQATELSARQPLLDAAADGLAAAKRDLEALDVDVADANRRWEAEKARITVQQREVEAETARLGAVDVKAEIALVDRQITASREALVGIDARIEGLIRAQVIGETERNSIDRELQGAAATQSRADQLSAEIAHWKLLAKGLGPEGVIALTIDDAGPALTGVVNDLLLACYGRRFTVDIRTQRALATGELREGFDILVHDADLDSTKAVSVMSGGQKVWINECLTRGIALYLAGNAGQPYRTLFSDESDGPLDPERKLQFMRMKREVLRQGGYEREFFISQTPDLIAEADAVIDVAALAA